MAHVSFVAAAAEFYVSTSGVDTNPGTLGLPWRTIQKAVDMVTSGDTVNVRAGTYAERVTISGKDGTAVAPITFQKYEADTGTVIIDQTGVTPPNGATALLRIENSDHIVIRGLELANYKTVGTNIQQRNQLPVGIYVAGDGDGVQILNCKVHDVWQSSATLNNFDANGFGIAVYGTAATPINNLVIDGCEVYALRTGASESVVLNGNVTNFRVSNNLVHDCNNIGVDFIGYEGSAPTVASDRARNGICVGNTVWNIDSAYNPAYGGNFSTGGGETSAAGIYVDGGTQIIIDRNHVFRCNFGVELASEAATGFTDYITLRNNLIHHNQIAGLIMGGYDRLRGQTRFCQITGNTFYRNDTLPSPSYSGQIALQFYVSNCSFRNNIVWANSITRQLWLHYPGDNSATAAQKEIGVNVTLDYNRYFCSTGGANDLEFGVFKNGAQRYHNTLNDWKGSVNGLQTDTNSVFGSPGFTAPAPGAPPSSPGMADLAAIRTSFELLATSAAVNAGDPALLLTDEKDLYGQSRVVGGRVDIGADEYLTSWQAWRDLHFSRPEGGGDADAGDDVDGDGATNLLEYSQGMTPTRYDAGLLPSISRAGGVIRFTYRKEAPELTYVLRRSQELTSWFPAGLTELSLGGGLYGVDLPQNPSPQFIRLEVSQP